MRRMRTRVKLVLLLGAVWGALVAGCEGRTSVFPNSDKNLRKTPAQWAADAAKRHPFNADLPSGGEAVGRAQVGYVLNKIEVWNGSDADWENVEIWVNRSYVCFVPKIEAKGKRVKTIEFEMLYDGNGKHFPTDNKQAQLRIRQLEMLKDGKIYTIPLRLAD
jgi:hypothetical protein